MRKLAGVTMGLLLAFTMLYIVAASRGWTDRAVRDAVTAKIGEGRGAWFAGGVLGGLLAADLVLPVPSSVVMTLSGVFLGVARGALVSFAGAMAGSLAGFGMCRVFGRRAFARVAGAEDAARVERFLDRFGAWAIILSRSVPMLAEVVSCVAGLGGVHPLRFCALSAAGTMPVCLAYAWAGAEGGSPAGMGWVVLLAFVLPAAGLWLAKVGSRERKPA